MAENIIEAPFTPEQVEALNWWQGRPDRHPFSCPADGTNGSGKHGDRRILFATEAGWECEWCGYMQLWAHRVMAEGDR